MTLRQAQGDNHYAIRNDCCQAELAEASTYVLKKFIVQLNGPTFSTVFLYNFFKKRTANFFFR